MNVRRLTVAAVLASALAVGGAGIGYAEPATDMNYNVTLVDHVTTDGKPMTVKARDGRTVNQKLVVATLDKGSFALAKGQVDKDKDGKPKVAEYIAVKDSAGKTREALSLKYRMDGMEYPVAHEISKDKRTVRLLAMTDRRWAKKAVAAPADAAVPNVNLKSIASEQENGLSLQNLMTQLGVATTVGGLLGTGVGAVAGGLAGLLVAGSLCFIPPFVTCLLTALPIMATFAGAGGVAGTVLAGGPTLLATGWDYINTVQAPEGTTPYQATLDKAKADEIAKARASAGTREQSHR